jgi:PAS domain S-box-containing protein
MINDKGSKISLERGGRSALRIAAVYVLVSAIWIIASDRVLLAIFRDPGQITSFQTFKGWAFILLSGGLIFILARREYIGWMRSASALDDVNRALRVLNACNHALVHIREEAELLSAICKVITEEGGYRMAWVGYVDDSGDGAVRPVAWQGFEDGYLEKKRITRDDSATGHGPSGEALRTRQPVVVRNILLDPRFTPWREEALLRGYSSVISMPLEAENQVLGILSIYHRRVDVFDTGEVGLLMELAQDLAYGIAAIRSNRMRLEAEHHLTESRSRFQSLVENAPLGIAISSKGVFRYVNPAYVSMFGYQDSSQLVDRPVIELIAPEQRSAVAERIKLRELGEQGAQTDQLSGLRQDGSTFFVRSHTCMFQWEGSPASLGFFTDITPLVESERLLKEREQRYRTLFEQSPISLWEEDFSAIVAWARTRRQEGVEDLRAYLHAHPQELHKCVSDLRVLDVNQATLQLYHAASKDVLLQGIASVSEGEGLANHIDSILAVADGYSFFEEEVVNFTLDGDRLVVLLRWHTFPGHEQDFERVIISIQDITAHVHIEQNLRQQNQRLSALRKIDKAIGTSLDLRVTLNVLLDQVLIELQVDAASIRLLNPLTHDLDIVALQGFRMQSPDPIHLFNDQCAPVRAVLERQPQHFSRQRQAASGTFAKILDQEGFDDYFATPLMSKGKVQGVLEVYHRGTLERVPDWHDFLDLLAGEAAIAVENARLFEKLQRSNLDLMRDYDLTIETMVKAMQLRQPVSLGHTPGMIDMTLRLAREIGLNDEQLVAIRRGALLHDIGMLAIPDALLFKPVALKESEWELIRQHPQVGASLLSQVHFLRDAIDVPYCHHEHWDGSGYPRALKGEQIPIAARIFAVVDVWDSLLSSRPFRDAWPPQQVLDYLRQQAGVQFDPQVVDKFLQLLAEQRVPGAAPEYRQS